MKTALKITSAGALAALLLAVGSTAHAASSVFTGKASVNWNNSTNWLSGAVPLEGDDLVIADLTTNASLTLNDATHTVGLVQLGTTGTRSAVFTINGNVTGAGAYPLTITNGVVVSHGATAPTGGNLPIKAPVIVQGDQVWSVNGSVPASGNDYGVVLAVGVNGTQRPLALNGTLTKVGAGELCFIGQNVSGSGNIVVNQGWFKLNAGSSTLITVGGTGTITVNTGAVFMIAKNSGTLFITKPITLNDGATLRLGGNNTAQAYVGSPVTFNGTVPIVADYASLALGWTNSWSGNLNSTITGNGGTVTLWADDSGLTGTVNNNGTFHLRFGANNSASAGVSWGLNSATAYYDIYGAATGIQFGALRGTAGTVINNNTNNAAAVLTVGALNTDTTFAGVLADGTGVLGLSKVGTGTLTLAGTNTLSGGVVVNTGGVVLQGAYSTLGSGPVTVGGNSRFGGSGSALGTVNVQSQGTLVADGGTGAPSLTVGPLTLGAAGGDITTNVINVYLGGKVVATSGLTVNGTSVINVAGAAPAVGTYDLIQHPGTIGGAGFAGFQLGSLPYGVLAHLQNGATAVQLVVDAITIEPSVWTGSATATWNLAGTLDWKGATSGTPQSYHEQDTTSFDDSATSFTVNIVTNVTPASMAVKVDSHTYTFTGAGSILGLTALGKDGAGTLVIANNNGFTGGTFVTNGTVQIGAGGTNGTLAGPIDVSGTLSFNRSDNLSQPGLISGTGSLEQKGTGITTLAAANTYEGLTTITSGTLAAGTGTSFGNTNNGIAVAAGATLDVNSQALGMEPISATGTGVGGQGAIVNNGPGDQQSATRFVTLTGDATFGGLRRWDIRNPSSGTDTSGGTHAFLHGNGYNLTKVGSNVVAFINVGNTALGNVAIQTGTLTFSRSTQPGNSAATLSVWPGATLQLHRLNEYAVNPLNKVVGVTNGTLATEANGLTNEISGPVTVTGSNTVSVPGPTNGMWLSSTVSGSGSLNAVGPGPLILSGSANPAGGITASGGLLEVNGTLSGVGVTALTSATLGGAGTISSPVTIPTGCTLSPGSSDPATFGIGALSVSALTLQTGSTSRFDVNTDLTSNDRLNASGAITYAGTLVITNQGYTPYAPGMSFKLFNGTAYSGVFSSIVPATPALGLLWDTNTLATDGTVRVIVVPTPRPLLVLSASSLLSNLVNVVFDTEVDQGTALDPNNYTLSTGQAVSYCAMQSATNVELNLVTPLTAATYSVQVKNVKDLAYIPNVVATTNVPARFWNFLASESILITNGYAFAYGDKIKVYADGADIFGTSDQFRYVYQELTGDFDVSVCLESFRITDPAAKAGLMAREINSPGVLADDRHFMSAAFTADPTRNNNFVEYREATAGTTFAPGAPRPGATYPTNWLRLKRTGSVMQGFAGPNGLDWTPMTAVDSATNVAGAYPVTVRLGLAVTSHNAAQTTEAVFHSFGKARVRPTLAIEVSGANVIVSWTPSALGWTLQASPGLVAPDANWVNVPGSSAVNTVTLPLGSGTRFFRMVP